MKLTFLLILRSAWCDIIQFGYDEARSNYNPSESSLTKTIIRQKALSLFFNISLGGAVISQPLFVSKAIVGGFLRSVVFVGTESGKYFAVNSATGEILWSRSLGTYKDSRCPFFPGKVFGITGTAYIDKPSMSIFLCDGSGSFHRLNVSNGQNFSPAWPIPNIFTPSLDHNFGAISKMGSLLYVTIASHCDIGQYQGKILAFDMNTAKLVHKFVPSDPFTGGGMWGSGGIAIDTSRNLIGVATGNSLTKPETAGYGEHIVTLYRNLTVKEAYQPSQTLLSNDGDFGGTPTLVRATNGCGRTLLASEMKSGYLIVTDFLTAKEIQVLAISSQPSDSFISAPAFDPSRNILYVANPVTSSNLKYKNGIVALKLNDSCKFDLLWNTVIGTSGSANPVPTPMVAGGIVFATSGKQSQVFALDADTGAILWRSRDALGWLYASPTVIDGMLFVADCGKGYDGVSSRLWAYRLLNRTSSPSKTPSRLPTRVPTRTPSAAPVTATKSPNSSASKAPTQIPSGLSTRKPSLAPTKRPSAFPTKRPSAFPTKRPSAFPTKRPTVLPESLFNEQPFIKVSIP